MYGKKLGTGIAKEGRRYTVLFFMGVSIKGYGPRSQQQAATVGSNLMSLTGMTVRNSRTNKGGKSIGAN